MAMNIALGTTTDKTLDQNKLVGLQNEANKYGGISSDNFKNYVNTNYGQGAYDVIKQGVVNTGLQSQNQTNVSTAQKLATPTQTQQPASSGLEGVKGYDASQVGIPGVNLASPSTATTPPSPTIQSTETTQKQPIIMGGTTTAQPTQTQTTMGGQNIDDVLNNMFPKGTYSEDERNAMKQMLQSKKPEEIATILAEQAKGNYTQSQNLLNAYRTTRDFGLSQQREQTLNDRRIQDLTQQYDNAITNQKQKMEADANNMAMVQGTSGRLQSRNMMNGINQMLDTNKNIYNQLVSNKERDIQRLAQDLEYAQKIASNEYNDMVNQEMQDMLKGIQALDSSGSLATAQGLVQARDFVDKTISNNMQHQADYYSKLSFIAQRFDTYHKEALQASTIDDSVTKTMGDGYLYNAQGMRVKDEKGQPLRVAGSTQGTLLTKEPIVLNDGSKAFVYQNPDGTMRTEKIIGTEAKQIDQNTISKYAQALSTGLLDIGDLQKMGVSNADINNIVAQTNGKVETMTPYQTAQTELDKKKYELELAKFNAEQAGGGSTISGNINFTITPGTTNNRPDRNNNPGNVKGGQGIGKDDQGHTIFATPEQGYQAMIDDLTAKQTGKSTRVSKITGKKLGPDSTLADLGSVYAEDPKWGQNVARLSGYSTQTLLKNIDINKLAPAIAKQEGFTGTIGTGQKEYTESQKNLMNMIDTKNISKIEEAQLKKAGLGIQDVANYKTANPKADTDTVLKIRTHFDALPEVKDWDTAQGVREWLRTAKSGNLSGPDIQGLISNYAKILDPTSVVRELEYTMAQSGASQGVIDKTKQQIATFIAGGSNVLSKDAQGVLVKAMQKRLDAMETAYLNKAKQEVKRTNALGIPLTIEQLTGEQEVQPQTNTTQANKTESTQFSPAIQNIKKTYLNY